MMPESIGSPPEPPPDPPQPLTGFMTNSQWSELLGEADGLLREMEELPFPNVKEQVFALLATIDTIHREALRRLVRLFKDGVLEKVVTDPAIHTLMELYDLLPPGAKEGDEQRAKILFTTSPAKAPPASQKKPKPKYPHWVPVLPCGDDVSGAAVKECQVEDRRIVLCRTGDDLFALDALCLQDGSSLAGGTLSKYTLSCPHHAGCYYDIRDGARIAGSGRLDCFPVKKNEGGRILVGIDMDFNPRRPSF